MHSTRRRCISRASASGVVALHAHQLVQEWLALRIPSLPGLRHLHLVGPRSARFDSDPLPLSFFSSLQSLTVSSYWPLPASLTDLPLCTHFCFSIVANEGPSNNQANEIDLQPLLRGMPKLRVLELEAAGAVRVELAHNTSITLPKLKRISVSPREFRGCLPVFSWTNLRLPACIQYTLSNENCTTTRGNNVEEFLALQRTQNFANRCTTARVNLGYKWDTPDSQRIDIRLADKGRSREFRINVVSNASKDWEDWAMAQERTFTMLCNDNLRSLCLVADDTAGVGRRHCDPSTAPGGHCYHSDDGAVAWLGVWEAIFSNLRNLQELELPPNNRFLHRSFLRILQCDEPPEDSTRQWHFLPSLRRLRFMDLVLREDLCTLRGSSAEAGSGHWGPSKIPDVREVYEESPEGCTDDRACYFDDAHTENARLWIEGLRRCLEGRAKARLQKLTVEIAASTSRKWERSSSCHELIRQSVGHLAEVVFLSPSVLGSD
ncbi:hypothetical protein NM688_g7664 [Phlebia brevispora]|uniref:Uncharacterized protein n=1 Tax=Phlebia brevispora TaxID=194682 RepID=A0ACC1S2J3_9APHY|nr:hypothetical protein NM688_g7664 [Phlebia brevispora]